MHALSYIRLVAIDQAAHYRWSAGLLSRVTSCRHACACTSILSTCMRMCVHACKRFDTQQLNEFALFAKHSIYSSGKAAQAMGPDRAAEEEVAPPPSPPSSAWSPFFEVINETGPESSGSAHLYLLTYLLTYLLACLYGNIYVHSYIYTYIFI